MVDFLFVMLLLLRIMYLMITKSEGNLPIFDCMNLTKINVFVLMNICVASQTLSFNHLQRIFRLSSKICSLDSMTSTDCV